MPSRIDFVAGLMIIVGLLAFSVGLVVAAFHFNPYIGRTCAFWRWLFVGKIQLR